jgi:hypothetical protein
MTTTQDYVHAVDDFKICRLLTMKAICKQITSEGFDLKEVTTVTSTNHDYSAGGYGLELGKEYFLMGMAVYKDSNCIYFLIDNNGRPDWLPHLLFNVTDNTLPIDWFVRVNGKKISSDIYCLWGLEELCNDEGFYDKLTNRDKEAMQIFFKRKSELEEYS